MKELLVTISIVATVLIAMTALIMVPVTYLSSKSCSQRAEMLGYGHEYGIIKGCFWILPDGRVIPGGQSYTVITH